jgi:hypothetical protein
MYKWHDIMFIVVIIITFQSVFLLKIYCNKFLYFLKFIFNNSTSKLFKNTKKIFNLK